MQIAVPPQKNGNYSTTGADCQSSRVSLEDYRRNLMQEKGWVGCKSCSKERVVGERGEEKMGGGSKKWTDSKRVDSGGINGTNKSALLNNTSAADRRVDRLRLRNAGRPTNC